LLRDRGRFRGETDLSEPSTKTQRFRYVFVRRHRLETTGTSGVLQTLVPATTPPAWGGRRSIDSGKVLDFVRSLGQRVSMIRKLESWYVDQCDGDWEHGLGITIESLDNPGWMLRINIEATSLDQSGFDWVKIERSDLDWVFYRSTGRLFEAACGPQNLEEAIRLFLDFAGHD